MVELERHLKIVASGGLGTLADQLTTKIALTYPELYEANPMANAFNEFTFAAGGGEAVYALAKVLGQSDDLALALGMLPSGAAWVVSLSNLLCIAYAHKNHYPWNECPILYPE